MVYFFNEIVRIYEQGNKALINWVGRSVQEYIALSLFRIDLPLVNQYEKGCGQYIPALTSHSVNKSIVLYFPISTLHVFLLVEHWWVTLFFFMSLTKSLSTGRRKGWKMCSSCYNNRKTVNLHYIFIISQLWLTSHPRSTVVLLDTGTPGTSREIYSENADGETRTRNPWITNAVL